MKCQCQFSSNQMTTTQLSIYAQHCSILQKAFEKTNYIYISLSFAQMAYHWVVICFQCIQMLWGKNTSLKQFLFLKLHYDYYIIQNLSKQWNDSLKSNCLIKTQPMLYPSNPVIHRDSLHWHISLTVPCWQRENTLDWALSCSGQWTRCSKFMFLQGVNEVPTCNT